MNSWGLFWAFVRMGTLAFGGGPSMIPLMKTECVDGGFVTEGQFMDGLAVGNALPGPIATKLAVYVGYSHGGFAGAALALFALLLPSTAMMGAFAGLLAKYGDHPMVKGALVGLKPAIIGMLAFTVIDLAPAGISGVGAGLLAVTAFLAMIAGLHPGLVILGAMAIGAYGYRP
jgi:chromate transporter